MGRPQMAAEDGREDHWLKPRVTSSQQQGEVIKPVVNHSA